MRSVFAVLFLFFGFILQGADTTAIIRGKVVESSTGLPLAGTNVIMGKTRGTITNEEGFFSIKTLPGNVHLTFQFVGYKSLTRTLHLNPSDIIDLRIEMDPEAIEIEQIVVSADKVEQKLSDLTVSMSVIKPEVLAGSHITNAQELMNKTSGIEVLDGQASIRGGSGFSYGAGSRVLALIDGLPILAVDAGNIKWQFLPLENLSQIEIIKGASSVLYGSSALNGIINFRTAEAKMQPVTKFYIETGIYDKPQQKSWVWWDSPRIFSSASFSHIQKTGNTDFGISANMLYNNGYRRLNDEKLGRFGFKLKRKSDRLEGLFYGINLNTGITKKRDFLLWEDADYGALKQNESIAMELQGTSLALDPFIGFKKKERSTHDLRTRIQLTDNKIPDAAHNNSQAFSFLGEYHFRYNLTESIAANLGLSESFSRIVSPFYGDHTGINFAGFAQLDIKPSERFKFTAGLRIEQNILDEDRDKIVPVFRTGINYKVMDYTFLRASFGQGYRYPSIAEKYASTTLGSVRIFPNPLIMPEKGWNTEIGIKQGFLTGTLNGLADFSLFYSQNKDLIEYMFGSWKDPVTGEWDFGFRSSNVENSRVYGFEMEVMMRNSIGNFYNSVSGGYVFMYPVEFNKYTGANTDIFLKYRRKHSGKLNINTLYRKFEVGLSLFLKSRTLNIDNIFLDDSILPGFSDYWTNNNRGHFLMDGNLGYSLTERFKLSVVVKNISNTEYMGRPGDIMPQRNFSIRISGNF